MPNDVKEQMEQKKKEWKADLLKKQAEAERKRKEAEEEKKMLDEIKESLGDEKAINPEFTGGAGVPNDSNPLPLTPEQIKQLQQTNRILVEKVETILQEYESALNTTIDISSASLNNLRQLK